MRTFDSLNRMNVEDEPLDELAIRIDPSAIITEDFTDEDSPRIRRRRFRRGEPIPPPDVDGDEARRRGGIENLGLLVPISIAAAIGLVATGAYLFFSGGDEAPETPAQDQIEQADAAADGQQLTDVDTDGDGLFDDDERFDFATDPENPDTDGDGVNDGDEIDAGTNPLRREGETDEERQAREDAEFDQTIDNRLELASFEFDISETITSLEDGVTGLEVLAAGVLGANGAVVDQTPRSEQILVDFDFGWAVGTDSMVYGAITGSPFIIAGSCIELDGKDASGPVILDTTIFGNSTCPGWAADADVAITLPVFQSFSFDIFDENTQLRVVFPTPFTVDVDFEGISIWGYAPVGDQWQYANYWLPTDDLATGNTVVGLSRAEFDLMQQQYPPDTFDITDPVQRGAHRMVSGVEQQDDQIDCFGYVHPQLNVELYRCNIDGDPADSVTRGCRL